MPGTRQLWAVRSPGLLLGDSSEASAPWVFEKRHTFIDLGQGLFQACLAEGWKQRLQWVLAGGVAVGLNHWLQAERGRRRGWRCWQDPSYGEGCTHGVGEPWWLGVRAGS